MSLRVWLPLTKDLRQQGLSNVTVINNGATFNSTGKLGGCYSFDGSTSFINTNINIPNFALDKTYSITCWVCPSGASGQKPIVGIGPDWSWTIFQQNTDLRFVQWDESGSRWGDPAISGVFSANTWVHIGVVWNQGVLLFYKNGEKIYEWTAPTSRTIKVSSDTVKIGGNIYAWGNNYFNGKLNDVRIYDHCLSPMEVKELAKGLVLHYPLADKNIESTTNLVIGLTAGGQTIINGTTVQTKGESNADTYFYIKTSTLTSGATYSLSCYVTGLENGKYWSFGIGAQSGTNKCCSFVLYNGYNSCTFTLPSGLANATQLIWDDDTYNINRATTVMKVSGIQLEQKDHSTGFTPFGSSRNNNTVYDCSGFCNNGTKWAYDINGIIEIAADTPKYQVSTYINSTNNTTNTASGTQYIYGDCILTTPQYLTIAFWCKPIAGYGNNTGQGQFSLTNNNIGSDAGSDYQGGPMNHRDSIVDINGSNGTTHKTVSINFTANEWHHYVIVYDGRYARVYKDGIATATADMGSTMTLGSMKGAVIGFSKAGGVWRSNKSYFSDFRIYATALFADDVKSLYQNCATIDPDGTIRGQIRN